MQDYVSVENIAHARDKRSEKVRALFSKKKCSATVQFTLNIPGRVKDSPLYRQIFREGVREIEINLNKEGTDYDIAENQDLFTGSEAYFILRKSDPVKIKASVSLIEDNHPLGRIFDIDVFSPPGDKLSAPGRSLRKCYICGSPAFVCARTAVHTVESLLDYIRITAENYFNTAGKTERDAGDR